MKVGNLVYRAYNPRTPGKVVEVFDPRIKVPRLGNFDRPAFKWVDAKVKWIDDEETYEEGWNLNSFTKLIEDHRRRLLKHEAKLSALESL